MKGRADIEVDLFVFVNGGLFCETFVALLVYIYDANTQGIYSIRRPKCANRSTRYLLFLSFFKSFWRTHVLFKGHWYSCFGFLVTSPLGFKARVGSALFTFCRGKCNVHSPRSTSGATHADLLAANNVASHFNRGWTWLRFEWAIIRTKDKCATIVLATRL